MTFKQNKPTPNSPLNSAEIRDNLQHLKESVNKEHNWDDSNPANTTHRLDQINAAFSGSKQANLAGGSYIYNGTYYAELVKTSSGVKAGKYSLQDLLQQLVEHSHAHAATTFAFSSNCNCNCDCNCGGNN